jgi:hypothetical protein
VVDLGGNGLARSRPEHSVDRGFGRHDESQLASVDDNPPPCAVSQSVGSQQALRHGVLSPHRA